MFPLKLFLALVLATSIEANDRQNKTESCKLNKQGEVFKGEAACYNYKTPFTKLSPTLIGGGKDSLVRQFPHVVAIGYERENKTEWLCAGSLLSDRFVLTAAHCVINAHTQVSNKQHTGVVRGPIKILRMGDIALNGTYKHDTRVDFEVKRSIVHPDYKLPQKYNDIALIELSREVQIDANVRPLCLQRCGTPPSNLTVAGWGYAEYFGKVQNVLQFANINVVPIANCSSHYSPSRRLLQGIADASQICAYEHQKDTCQGDSGGPLFYYDFKNKVFRIAGITSFGIHCLGNAPGVYTRVSNYVDWIESIVWAE